MRDLYRLSFLGEHELRGRDGLVLAPLHHFVLVIDKDKKVLLGVRALVVADPLLSCASAAGHVGWIRVMFT